jgi:hypothetical protein
MFPLVGSKCAMLVNTCTIGRYNLIKKAFPKHFQTLRKKLWLNIKENKILEIVISQSKNSQSYVR